MTRPHRSFLVVAFAFAFLLSACSSATPTTVPSPSSPASSPPECPSSHGGVCLGELTAGTYTTVAFQPTLEYTVPDGWANFEDLPGNFLLVPPGGSLDGVDAGTSDYLGVYTHVVAANQSCAGGPAAGVGPTAQDLVDFYVSSPSLETTEPRAVEVGGLSGYVVDIAAAPAASLTCDGLIVIPLFVGQPPSDLEHAALVGIALRLYLLDYNGGTLVIEVDDVGGAGSLDEYDAVVNSLTFTV